MFSTPCRLEVGDTAGWKPALRRQRVAGIRASDFFRIPTFGLRIVDFMPKDEFDFEDPLELNGMAFMTHEDTTNDMAETFIEEFMRMGYGHKQILALFRNPHYLGPNMALEKRGEPFIRDLIADVFARWGKVVIWPESGASDVAQTSSLPYRRLPVGSVPERAAMSASASPSGLETRDTAGSETCAARPTDPTGAPLPEYTD
jgi:hypothetical protein